MVMGGHSSLLAVRLKTLKALFIIGGILKRGGLSEFGQA